MYSAIPGRQSVRLKCIIGFLLLLYPTDSIAEKKRGQERIDSLLQELAIARVDSVRIKIMDYTCREYGNTNPDEGIRYGLQALALAQKSGWDEGIANSYNVLGICAMNKSDFQGAVAYWRKGLSVSERQGNKQQMLKMIGNIGVVNVYQGDYAHALESYFQALKYAEDLNDKRSVEINLGNISAAYQYLGDFDLAIQYNAKTLKLDEELRDTTSMAITLSNLANIYSGMKQYDKLAQVLQQAIAYDMRLGNTENMVRSMFNLGSSYSNRGQYLQALETLIAAKQRQDAAGISSLDANGYSYLAEALIGLASDTLHNYSNHLDTLPSVAGYRLNGNKASLLRIATVFLEKSIAINKERASLPELAQNYRFLSDAQRLTGDYQAALESHRLYTRLKDSVFTTDIKIKTTNLETRRAIALKDKQIEIDRLEVAKKRNERVLFGAGFVLLLIVVVIVIRNIRLSTAKELSENKLNAFQARMNPHFIFNSLSSIQSLILNNETEQSIDYLSEFSTLMRQILDNSGQSKVTLQTEIDMLRSYIELEHLRFDGFQWTITISDNVNPESVDVPGMVIQPFVENAILHGLVSKGDEGRLDITFGRDEKHILCTVEDNGVGRERSAEINRKRSKTRQSHGTAIAINRLLLLADKKRGLTNEVIYIDKMEDGVAAGTKVIIQLPIL